jgi:hypothetical protein
VDVLSVSFSQLLAARFLKLYTCVKIYAMSHDEDLEKRPDDDDYDLLTFGEAGARLVEEVRKQERRIAELTATSATPTEVTAAKARLDALLAAQVRNRKPSLEQLKASGFFAPPKS